LPEQDRHCNGKAANEAQLHPYAESVPNPNEIELGSPEWTAEQFNELVGDAKCGNRANDDGNGANQHSPTKLAEVVNQRRRTRHARDLMKC
jgi:hypothetical protein